MIEDNNLRKKAFVWEEFGCGLMKGVVDVDGIVSMFDRADAVGDWGNGICRMLELKGTE